MASAPFRGEMTALRRSKMPQQDTSQVVGATAGAISLGLGLGLAVRVFIM